MKKRAKVAISIAVAAAGLGAAWTLLVPAVLARRLASPDWKERQQVARLLVSAPVPRRQELIARALADEDPNVVVPALNAVIGSHATELEPQIIELAVDRSNDLTVRHFALEALLEIGTERCLEGLISIFSEPQIETWGFEPGPKVMISRILLRVTGRDLGPDGNAWRAWWATQRGRKS